MYIYLIYGYCLTNVPDLSRFCLDYQKTMLQLENLPLVLSTHLKQVEVSSVAVLSCLKGLCWLRFLFQFLFSAKSSDFRLNLTKINKNHKFYIVVKYFEVIFI